MAMLLIFMHIKGVGTEEKLKRIYLRHSVIFISGYLIVFFQRAVDFSLGIFDEFSPSVKLLWADVPHVVSKAAALSLLGLSAFLFGYHFCKSSKMGSPKFVYRFKYKKELVFSAFLLIALYVSMTGIGDFSKSEEAENIGYLMVAQAVFLAIIVIYSYEYKHKFHCEEFKVKNFVFPLSLIVFYIFVYLATGNRGGAIKTCIMLLAAYVYIVKDKVNYKRTVFFFICGALAITLVGIVRTMTTKDANDVATLLSATETVSPLTVELSGSVNTVHLALANVPLKRDYDYGLSFFSGFTVLIPGLSRITDFGENSGDIITKMYFGDDLPGWSWGFGSSAIADVYLSYGLIGVLLIFFIFGCFIHYLEYGTFVIDKSPLFLVLSFCVYSQLLSLCRGPFSILFLSWDYALIIVYICSIRLLKKCF